MTCIYKVINLLVGMSSVNAFFPDISEELRLRLVLLVQFLEPKLSELCASSRLLNTKLFGLIQGLKCKQKCIAVTTVFLLKVIKKKGLTDMMYLRYKPLTKAKSNQYKALFFRDNNYAMCP